MRADTFHELDHDHSVRALVLCKFCLQCRSNLAVALFGQFASLAVNFARRAERQLKGNRIIDIFANEELSVYLFKPDVPITGNFQLLVTTPVSAIEKGPGPQVNAFSPGGGRYFNTTSFA